MLGLQNLTFLNVHHNDLTSLDGIQHLPNLRHRAWGCRAHGTGHRDAWRRAHGTEHRAHGCRDAAPAQAAAHARRDEWWVLQCGWMFPDSLQPADSLSCHLELHVRRRDSFRPVDYKHDGNYCCSNQHAQVPLQPHVFMPGSQRAFSSLPSFAPTLSGTLSPVPTLTSQAVPYCVPTLTSHCPPRI